MNDSFLALLFFRTESVADVIRKLQWIEGVAGSQCQFDPSERTPNRLSSTMVWPIGRGFA